MRGALSRRGRVFIAFCRDTLAKFREYRKQRRQFYLRIIFYGGLAVIASWLDPLGLDTVTNRHSERLIKRAVAPFYPSTGQERTTVVLFTEDTTDAFHTIWPLRYLDHGTILRRILQLKPKAVFIDIMIPEVRSIDPTMPQLVHQLRKWAGPVIKDEAGTTHQRIPVFIAARSKDGMKVARPLQEITQPVAIDWSGYGDNYPLYVSNASDGRLATPAIAMYRRYCADTPGWPGCIRSGGDSRFQAPMSVRWGSTVPPLQGEFSSIKNCQDVDQSWTSRGWFAVKLAVMSLFEGVVDEARRSQRCPFNLTIDALLFRTARVGEDPFVREAITGRYIFVGTRITGGSDKFVSPVHGQLPGIYLNAMAFDNLVDFGDSYLRTSPHLGPGMDLGGLIAFSIWMTLVVIYAGMKWHYEAKSQTGEDFAMTDKDMEIPAHVRRVFLLCVAIPLPLSVALLLFWGLNFSPINWLGIVGLVFLIQTLMRDEALRSFQDRAQTMFNWLAVNLGGVRTAGEGQKSRKEGDRNE